jgi:excisionase family DNA binding protein
VEVRNGRCDHESGDRMVSEPTEIHLAEVQFLTVAEVAAMMRVSKMTVYRLVHGGELPAARVGRSFRVPKRAVEEYLHSAYFDAG